MANSGKNSNTSQYFITLPKTDINSPTEIQQHFAKLKGKYVVFGHLVNPIEDLNVFNDIPVNGETPKTEITISDCGIVN
jgi:cyclophilin family peptidyl-prolyl cis-trans isomerase